MSASEPRDPKERLLRVLRKHAVDRPPVICAGGSMTAAVLEAIGEDAPLPAAHSSPVMMANLCAQIQHRTGFENLGVPLCTTIEAEALGSHVSTGSLTCEPTIIREAFRDVSSAQFPQPDAVLNRGRVPVFLEATRILARDYPALPVLANLIGPTSTAAATVDPVAFLKGLRKDREHAHRLVAAVTRFLCSLATRLIEHGATVIVIHDDTATPALLGLTLFQEFTTRYLATLIEHIHGSGTPVILHLCGNLVDALPLLAHLGSDALSVGATTSVRAVKEVAPSLPVMGNVSTMKLHLGNPAWVEARAERLLAEGVDILAPACGLSVRTPLANIHALTKISGKAS
ncbi:MAG: uroporphyrinogen decarboxylase family protein [Isosphaeraceae bacterium]